MATSNPTSNKCVTCKKTVRKNQQAIDCDVCKNWTHRSCDTDISKEDYMKILKSETEFSFTCSICRVSVGNFSLNASLDTISSET
ncbi:hypothetical protein SNE40_005927 [Patella caerulea]|uniref:PHD-type domain-containing protein n=1 Tax=Patella caerulea TaxID=87958 RepID=A0AAN8K1E4_PATCE